MINKSVNRTIAIAVDRVMFGKGNPKQMLQAEIERIAKMFRLPIKEVAKIASYHSTNFGAVLFHSQEHKDSVVN